MVLLTIKMAPHPSGMLTLHHSGWCIGKFLGLVNADSMIWLQQVLFLDHYFCFHNILLSHQVFLMHFWHTTSNMVIVCQCWQKWFLTLPASLLFMDLVVVCFRLKICWYMVSYLLSNWKQKTDWQFAIF